MSLNLTGSYFGNEIGYQGQAPSGYMDTRSKAVLYVFKPYQNQFADVGLRPFIYHFDENFIGYANEITDMSRRGAVRAGQVVDSLMNRVNLNDNIIPSFNPAMNIRTSLLSDKWRFILLLTENGSDLNIGNTFVSTASANTQMRRIYTSYFEDEPFNPNSFSHNRRSLNPDSFMVITHVTKVGTSTSHGRLGAETALNCYSSEEIIHPQLSGSLSGQNDGMWNKGLYLMTPENCINSIETNDDGYSIAVPGAHSDISKDTGANVLSDVLEQPKQNVGQIIKGMVLYQDDVSNSHRLNTNKVDRYFDDTFLDESIHRQKLARYMGLARSKKMGLFDLDVDSRISPVDLDQMVNGALDVVPIDIQRPLYYETADQMEASITNQYSFLIASVVTPILQSAGLSEFHFEYQIAHMRGTLDDFQMRGAAAAYPVPDHDLRSMCIAVKNELVNGIFKTIFDSVGDFHVVVSAVTTGMTKVRLPLVAQGYKALVDFELPSCMGGLISPLLGDAASNSTNSEAIETLYNIATGTSPISNGFNDDDRSFMNYANTLSFDEMNPNTFNPTEEFHIDYDDPDVEYD